MLVLWIVPWCNQDGHYLCQLHLVEKCIPSIKVEQPLETVAVVSPLGRTLGFKSLPFRISFEKQSFTNRTFSIFYYSSKGPANLSMIFFNSNDNTAKKVLSYLSYFQRPDYAIVQLPSEKPHFMSILLSPCVWTWNTYTGRLLGKDVYAYCPYQPKKKNTITWPQNLNMCSSYLSNLTFHLLLQQPEWKWKSVCLCVCETEQEGECDSFKTKARDSLCA